jgi:hypothetical protein
MIIVYWDEVPCRLVNGTIVFCDVVPCSLINGTIVFCDVGPCKLVNGTIVFWDVVPCSLLNGAIVSLSPASIVLNLTCPEDGSGTFARNVCTCVPNYAASHRRILLMFMATAVRTTSLWMTEYY